MKKILGLIILIMFAAFAIYLTQAGSKEKPENGTEAFSKIKVAASFYPLFFFASEIGAEKAEVINITPPGAEPHDYEPTAKDVSNILGGKLLVINGEGFELWVDKLKADLSQNSVRIINASEEVSVFPSDPHVWLSPPSAKMQVDKILEGFLSVDPQNSLFFENNARNLKARLDELDAEYKSELNSCELKSFITSHEAFGYLAREYSLTQVPIAGLSPDSEPSAKQVVEISQFAKANNIEYIFFESLLSPRLTETIAREADAKTLLLDPIEGISNEDIKAGRNYFSVMRDNLSNLKLALRCP